MRVNLLPPEVRGARREAGLLRSIRFSGALLLVLLAGVWGVRTYEVLSLRAQIERVRAERVTVEDERRSLGTVAEARDAALAGRALASQLLKGEVSWADQLLDLSAAVPSGFTLTTVSGQANAAETGSIVGSVTFTATSRDFVPVQTWLIRIAAEEGWTNGWVSSIGRGDDGFGVSGSFDLTSSALTARGRGEA